MKRLILIDAHAIIHRAYHALPPLTSPSGEPAGAVYGFATILLRILRELKPDYITAAFDLPGPTFRHIAYERYKAHRPQTPTDLGSQFSKTEELLDAFNISVYKKEGYEADDIIGTIAEKFGKKKELEVVIVTGDLDALQLVGPQVRVYTMKKGVSETVIYDQEAVKERYGLAPQELIDFKGLRGDPSDNIPGVKGIGEKTAAELIQNFGSVEGVYGAVKKKDKRISPTLLEKLKAGEEDAKFSRELARINCKVPLEIDLERIAWRDGSRKNEIRELFQKFGFFSLLKRLDPEIQRLSFGTLPEKNGEAETVSTPREFARLFSGAKEKVGIMLQADRLLMVVEGKEKIYKIEAGAFSGPETKKFFRERDFFAYDGKSVVHFLQGFGIRPGKISFDLMIASNLTGIEARSYSLLAAKELGRAPSGEWEKDAARFFEISSRVAHTLRDRSIEKIFQEIELPLIPILQEMETKGILLDEKFLKGLSRKTGEQLRILTEKIHKLAGEEFNINSPGQLSRILFGRLKLGIKGLRKTEKGGVISTRGSELEKLRGKHEIVEHILQYREIAKLKTTYIDALPQLVNPKTGRLHTTFHQTGTVTGRLSSSNPNLQNIPAISELGREIRKAFVAERGFSLISFDYSQIELRVAAHLAGDPKMIEAFGKGVDIHRLTAAEVYDIPLEKVTPELRRAAKTLNFGVLYGMGPQAFSEATGFSKEDAKKFIQEYFHDFSGLADYIARTKKLAEERGYVETLYGRRRYIPEINSANWQLKREAERMAVNMPIQGTAADLVKMTMIEVDHWIKKEKEEKNLRMLLQVHDELLFEMREERIKEAVPKIKGLMENVISLKVPLVVEVKAGRNWGSQEAITSNQ